MTFIETAISAASTFSLISLGQQGAGLKYTWISQHFDQIDDNL